MILRVSHFIISNIASVAFSSLIIFAQAYEKLQRFNSMQSIDSLDLHLKFNQFHNYAMTDKIVKPKSEKIKEINITKKITSNNSEQYITVQIKYAVNSMDEIFKKAISAAETTTTNSSGSNPGIF